ncbi:response regulator [Mucilaginibacter sp. AK015]|uniref:response regulator n=1 Tax=Mucilaginibacter sp. AK015 TaxID=2723072 RepID=UPI00162120BB|nr:response regulator [Mucilaginibacter sp. AK015]
MTTDILLVSNDAFTINLFKDCCFQLAVKGVTRQSSQGLLNTLYKHTPDLVIIDFILEDGNGGSACHQIKCDKYLHNLPVALLTEYDNLQRFAPKFGCTHLLNKPLSLNDMTLLIAMLSETANAE